MEVQESNYLKSSLKHERGHNNHCMDSKKQVKLIFLKYIKFKEKDDQGLRSTNMEKGERNRTNTTKQKYHISSCTDGYARLTRLIGRLVKHQPYRNLTSRILTRSFAQNCN